MSIRNYLARRREEKRIARKSKRLYTRPKRGPTAFELRMQRLGNRSLSLADRFYLETQQRKGRGKEIVKERIMRAINNAPNLGKEFLRGPTTPRSTRAPSVSRARAPSIPKQKIRVPSADSIKKTKRRRR